MASLSLKNIYKRYESGIVAVSDFNLEIQDKEFIVLVGPSGCGKSTTLRMIAGLEDISEGEMYIGDRLINEIAPKNRDIAMVFQNYALYPHMTVYDNMAFGLKLRKTPKDEIKRRVDEAGRILDITHLLDRKPKALSGGQRQRVALGRAIVREPQVFLLDEPLSNLDAKLRAQMRIELTKLHARLGTTFIYVTHDQIEAMTMGDRIVVMKDGFVQQVDEPAHLYNKPNNMFVAGFVGSPQMNFIEGLVVEVDGELCVKFGESATSSTVKLPQSIISTCNIKDYLGKFVVLGIRPECLHDEEMFLSAAHTGVIECKVEATELMGAETYLYLDCFGTLLTAKVSPRSVAKEGDTISIAIDINRIHIFDKETEKAITN
jgi:multiple sugar transport system ATP-binding protein